MPEKIRPAPPASARGTSPGTVVAFRYSIEARLGKGGIGAVYLASDLHEGGRAVALKILREDRLDEERERGLKTEYSTLARLRHPHVEAVWDFGRDPHHGVYIAKEYLSGTDLMKATEGLSPEDCVILSVQLFRALAFLHSRRLIHNDIKPDNVIVVRDPTSELGRRLVLIDFGIASEHSHESTEQTATVVGTLGYLAPERVKGVKPDARTDLYAAGILLFRLITRQFPFNAKAQAAELLAFHLYQECPRPSAFRAGIPEAIDDLVLRLLSKDREKRYASAHDVLKAIGQITGRSAPLETEATQEGYVRSVALVGRDHELATLTSLVERGIAGERKPGEPALFIVEGEAGMGKSRLLAEILVRARLSGAQVLTGSGRKHGGGLGPLRTPLRRLMTDEEAKKSLEFLDRADEDEKADRTEILRTLGNLIVERGSNVVLALEDLHNADDLTLDLVAYLARVLKGSPAARFVCIATAREKAPNLDELRAKLLADDLGRIVKLLPLSLDQATTFVTEALGRQPAPAFVQALHRKTGGDPEAVQEALKLLLAVGVLSDRTWTQPGGWELCADALPDGIIPILMGRLALLPPEARQALNVLAIVDRPFPVSVIAPVAELPPQTASHLLSDLAKREVVLTRVMEGDLYYLLAHDRMSQAVLAHCGEKELKDLHDRMARTLESFPSKRDEEWLFDLSYHAIRSGKAARAATHGLAAGKRLEAIYAWDQAIELYESLVQVPVLEGGVLVKTYLRLGGIHEQLGDTRNAMHYFALADRNANILQMRAERAKALHHAAAIAGRQGHRWKAEVRAVKALMIYEELGDQGGLANVKLLMAQFLYEDKDWRRALKLATEARRLFEEAGDISGLGQTLNLRGMILWKQGKLDEASHYFRQSYRIAGLVSALANWGSSQFELGDYKEANRIFRDALGLAKREGRLRDRAVVELYIGLLRYEEGNISKAHRLFESAFEAFEGLGEKTPSAIALASLARVEREKGRYAFAGELVNQAFEMLRDQPPSPALGAALRQMSALAFLRGDLDVAKQAGQRAAKTDARWGETKSLGLDALALAEVALERGSREEFLREIFDARSAFGAAHSGPGLLWTDLLLARGERCWGSPAEALKQLEECGTGAATRGMRLIEATCALETAQVQSDLGDDGEALGGLGKALKYAREQGTRSLECQVRIQLSMLYLRGGDVDRAVVELKECEAAAADPHNVFLSHAALSQRARLLLARNQLAEALAQAASVAQQVRPMGLARLTIAADLLVAEVATAANQTKIALAARQRVHAAIETTGYRLNG